MTLLERAADFVEHGHPRYQTVLLAECVRAHNLDGLAAVQRLYEDMYGGITFNFELKVPAAVCLVIWGDAGINALMEGVRRTPSSKNISITVQLLGALAAGSTPNLLLRFVDPALRGVVEASFRTPGLRTFARQRLTEFVLSLDEDEALHVAGSAFQQLSLEDHGSAKEVFAALASRWLTVGKPILARYGHLSAITQTMNRSFTNSLKKCHNCLIR
jgi:hypothetical protein